MDRDMISDVFSAAEALLVAPGVFFPELACASHTLI
jgi:hypothetical protein